MVVTAQATEFSKGAGNPRLEKKNLRLADEVRRALYHFQVKTLGIDFHQVGCRQT